MFYNDRNMRVKALLCDMAHAPVTFVLAIAGIVMTGIGAFGDCLVSAESTAVNSLERFGDSVADRLIDIKYSA